MNPTTPSNSNSNGSSNGPASTRFDRWRKRITALETLRDQVRVDLNLASKEVRARWQRIDARIRGAQQHLRHGPRTTVIGPLLGSVKRFRALLKRNGHGQHPARPA